MYYEEVFSWAENAEGKMVHVDTMGRMHSDAQFAGQFLLT